MTQTLLLARRDGTPCGRTRLDDQDAYLLSHRWYLDACGYVRRNVPKPGGGQRALLLHRAILGLEHGDGLEVDHRNRDKLDNRRANLRIVTHADNTANVGANAGSTSAHRGVSWARRERRWIAQTQINRHNLWIGYFDDELEAAAAVHAFREKHA